MGVGGRKMSSSEAAALHHSGVEPTRFTLWPMPSLGQVTSSRGPDIQAGHVLLPEEAAYDRGVEEGRCAARQELADEVQQVVQALGGAAEQLRAERAKCVKIMEQDVFTLGMAVARTVIQREVELDSSVVGAMVQRALTEVSWRSPVEVRLNPEDIAVVEAHFVAIEDDAKPPQVKWTPDSKVERGGYIVETPHRLVDGTLDSVLNNLYEHLTND